MSAETVLVAQLKATSAVTDLVSTQIYPMVAPQGVDLPFITYETTLYAPVNHAGGTTSTASCGLRVASMASTYAGAKAIAAVVETAVSGWTDDDGNIWHLESASDDIGGIIEGRDVPEYFAVVQEFSVWT